MFPWSPAISETLPVVRGEKLLVVPALPGVLAIAADNRQGYAIAIDRSLVRVDLEAGITSPLPFTEFTPSAIAVDPSGRWIAVGTEEQRVVVMDATTGAVVRTLNNNLAAVSVVAFSPDGRWLAAGDRDSLVYKPGAGWLNQPVEDERYLGHGATVVWDTAEWKRVQTLDAPRGTTVTALAFADDGAALYVIDAVYTAPGVAGHVSRWELPGGRLTAESPLGSSAAGTSYFFPAAIAAGRGEIEFCDAEGSGLGRVSLLTCNSPGRLALVPRVPAGECSAMYRARIGPRMVLGRRDARDLLLYSALSGAAVARLDGPAEDERVLILVSDPGETALYGVTDKHALWRWRLAADASVEEEPAWSVGADGGAAVALCYGVPASSPPAASLGLVRTLVGGAPQGPAASTRDAARLEFRGQHLRLQDSTGKVMATWDVAEGKEICRSDAPSGRDATPHCSSPFDSLGRRYYLARSAGPDGKPRTVVLDRVFGREIPAPRAGLDQNAPPHYAPIDDERFLLAQGTSLYLWDNGEWRTLDSVGKRRYLAAVAAPNGRHIACLYIDGRQRAISFFDVAAGELKAAAIIIPSTRPGTNLRASLSYSADGERLLWAEAGAAGEEPWNELRLFAVGSGETLFSLAGPLTRLPGLTASRFDRELHTHAAPSVRPNRVRVDLVAENRTVDLGRHRLFNGVLALSDNGRWLVTGAQDGTLKLWDAATGNELAHWWRHGSPVVALAFDEAAALCVLYQDGRIDVLAVKEPPESNS